MEKSDVLKEIFNSIEKNSGGRATICSIEEKGTLPSSPFLKVDGVRVGRDIYGYWMMGCIRGWELAVSLFALEVIVPVRQMGLTESYNVASEKTRIFGHTIFSSEAIPKWDKIFEPPFN